MIVVKEKCYIGYIRKKIEIGEIWYVGEVGRVGRFIHIKVWGLLKILFQIIHTII